MARNKPPSFDFFVDDFVAGTLGMHPAARGIYLSLLCYQWSNGSIPDPRSAGGKAFAFEKVSKRFCGASAGASEEELEEHLPEALSKFEVDENGDLVNTRTQREYEKKTEIREKRQAAGSLGGRPKAIAKQKVNKPKAKQEVGSGKKEVTKKKKNEPLTALECSAAEVPRELNSSEFRNAWYQWIEYKQGTETRLDVVGRGEDAIDPTDQARP